MLKLRGTFEFCLSDSLNKLLDILEKNASRSGGVQRNRSMRQTHTSFSHRLYRATLRLSA
jgi:hypothetical protein